MENGRIMGEVGKKISNFPQILAIVVACLASVTEGLLFSWTSPFIVQISKDKVNYEITEYQASYFTIIPPISMVLTCTLFTRLCDMMGRKGTLLLITIPHTVFWVITAVSTDLYALYVGRLLVGFADAIHFSALPIYIGEISTPKVRGTWGNSITVFFFLGPFIINVLGSYFSVWHTAYICLPLPIVFCMAMSCMPESPYYYIIKNRNEDAKNVLRWLRHKEDVEEEFSVLKTAVHRQMYEKGTWKDLVCHYSNRKALYAGLFLRCTQQLGGVAVFSTYTQLVFEKAGSNVSSEVSTMIYSGLSFLLICVAGTVVDMLGRKKSYLISACACGIALIASGIYLYLDFDLNDSLNWIPLAGMLLYVIFCSFGLATLPTLMLGELFSTSIKVKGLSLVSVMFGFMIIIANYIFYILKSQIGLYAPFLFFGGCNIVTTFLTIYFVPETSGKTLEEIQQAYKTSDKDNVKS